jgi:8-oxo-dGTP pyrophosphatase MutT (NUDIX family)
MRESQAALALIRRPGRDGPEFLVRWNDKWQALHLVGGHRHPGESFRACLCRELAEELGPAPGGDGRAADQPFAHLEYRAFSVSAQEETAYVLELFKVELAPAALAQASADPLNAWVGEAEVRAGRAGDGRAVSGTMRLLFDKAGLWHGGA